MKQNHFIAAKQSPWSPMTSLEELAKNARVTVRRAGPPNTEGRCVVYWMQRAQRVLDNPALNVAIAAANLLGKPVVAFYGLVPFYPNANLRSYTFLVQGLRDISEGLRQKNVGFVLRRWPDHQLERFCTEVQPCLVVGDENPLREPELWRKVAAERLQVPFWTVVSMGNPASRSSFIESDSNCFECCQGIRASGLPGEVRSSSSKA